MADIKFPWTDFVQSLPKMPWESAVVGFAESVSLPPDQIKYVSALLSGIPIGLIFRTVTADPFGKEGAAKASAINTRHNLCAVIGISMVLYAFGWEIFHSLFSSTGKKFSKVLLSFLLMHSVPRKHVHVIVTVWAMTYMSCAHIYRMVVDYGGWTIDFTTPQLLVTQKMMNIAFALYDSARDPAKLTAEQKQRKLDKPPTASEFYGYVFCLHTLLAGPATDYNDYITWIDGSKLGGAKCNTVFAILKKISGAVMCAIAFVVILPNCPVDNHGVSEWLSSNPHWYVLGYNQVSLFLVRHRYYFAWILGDAGCNAAGFGFNGLDARGAQKWDSVLNLDYVSVEMPLNFRSAMTGWNKATSNWLRRCVYERVPKGIATASSFFMSAIWHGFYPGYYLTFMSCALWNEVARLLRRHVRPLVIPNEAAEKSVTAYVYHACSLCLTVTSLNYLATPFLLLSADKSIQYWRHWGFAPHGIAVGLYILLPIIFAPKKAPKGEKLTEAQAKKAQ